MCEFVSGLVSVKLNEISIGDPTSHSNNKVHSGLEDWREFELTKNGSVDIRTSDSDDKIAYLATIINLIGKDLTLNSLRLKYSPSIDVDGNKYYWTTKGLHRKNGPAVIYSDGDKAYFLNGELHREDGPAVEYTNGHKVYYKNGELHREDGPAVERADGYKAYWLNDKLHRTDGPAVICPNGDKSYWLDDKKYTEEEFFKKTQ